MSKTQFLLFSLFSFFCFLSQGQTGPGGVGDSLTNSFWIKADQGTSTTVDSNPIELWEDQSGNANDVSQSNVNQRALFEENVLNGYPAINFDFNSSNGQNDFYSGADASNLDNTNGLTIFSVVRPTSTGSARSIIAKRVDVGVNQSYMFFFFTSNQIFADIVSNNDRFSTPTSFPANNTYLLTLLYDGTLPQSSRARVFSEQNLLRTASENSASIPDFDSPLVVGATHDGDNRAFGGYIAEIIIYRKALGAAEKIIVDNYLSAKYNLPLSSNDVYVQDDPINGNFDHDVAGIGRLSSTDFNSDAQGSGIVRINNPIDLDDDEFLLWGHNLGVAQAVNFSDVPPSVEARFERVWRVSEQSTSNVPVDVGAVDLQFDLSNLGSIVTSDLRLLIDSDNDGDFSDETPIAAADSLGDNIYRFSAVSDLSDGSRFTIATTNSNQTPLPITLIKFEVASSSSQAVELNWETATEINNHYFTVERSEDASNWTAIKEISGAGNSQKKQRYRMVDPNPIQGVSYYRLKQTDFDGEFEYFKEVSVIVKKKHGELLIFPNPTESNREIMVRCNFCENDILVELRKVDGKMVFSKLVGNLNENQEFKVSIDQQIKAGFYLISVSSGEQTVNQKLLINK